LRGLLACVDPIADRPTLHEDNRVMAILPSQRGRKAKDVLGLGLPSDCFEAHGREMVALVDDQVAIIGNELRNFPLPYQALDQCNVNDAGRFPFSTADHPNPFGIDLQKSP
jgi:hypothetical protein